MLSPLPVPRPGAQPLIPRLCCTQALLGGMKRVAPARSGVAVWGVWNGTSGRPCPPARVPTARVSVGVVGQQGSTHLWLPAVGSASSGTAAPTHERGCGTRGLMAEHPAMVVPPGAECPAPLPTPPLTCCPGNVVPQAQHMLQTPTTESQGGSPRASLLPTSSP